MVRTGRSTSGAAAGGTGGTRGTTSGGSTTGATGVSGTASGGGTTGASSEGPAPQEPPRMANVELPATDATDAESSGPVVFYPGDQITRAREMSRRDWQNFGVPDEDLPDDFTTTRWGPENNWTVPVSDLDAFLTEDQRDAFVQQNGLEVRES